MEKPGFFHRLFFGFKQESTHLLPAYQAQWIIVKRVWHNHSGDDYGIERLLRLVLALYPFVTLGLFVRSYFAAYGLHVRNLAIELYVLAKILVSATILIEATNPWWLLLPIYLGIETILHIFSLLFLSDQQPQPVFIRRTILLVLLNFLELIITYASLYKHVELSFPASFSCPPMGSITEPLTALYFSFITAGTIGYGDIVPVSPLAKSLVMFQVALSFLFVVLFISYFTGRFTQYIHQQGGTQPEAKD